MGRAYASRRDSGRRVKRAGVGIDRRRGGAAGMVKQSSSHEPPQRPRYTNHQQSEIVEMFVAQELIGQGWNVAYPRSSHSIFDLIAVQGSRALRIQVKSTRKRVGNRLLFDTTRYQAKAEKGARKIISCNDCDVAVLVSVTNMELFVVPVSHIRTCHFAINETNYPKYFRKFSNLRPCKP